MIAAAERRESGISAVMPVRIPLLAERQRLLRVDFAILQRLSEHAPRAPAPHFCTGRVEDDELVRLSAWKVHLDRVVREVGHLERELDVAADGDFRGCGERSVGELVSGGLMLARHAGVCVPISVSRMWPTGERDGGDAEDPGIERRVIF